MNTQPYPRNADQQNQNPEHDHDAAANGQRHSRAHDENAQHTVGDHSQGGVTGWKAEAVLHHDRLQ